LSPAVQVKLLRVIQEGAIEPVGGHTLRVDVRVVAATNRNLNAEVQAGRFREDLFYRLNVIAVTAPPLRTRREDIPLLIDYFLAIYTHKNHKPSLSISGDAMAKLTDYSWPGNVRELENAVERAVVLSRGDTVSLGDLPEAVSLAESTALDTLTFPIGTPLDEVEHRLIRETLKHTAGDKALAAQLLGISTRTIYRKLGDVEGAGRGDIE
jgi:two-component system response regulator HydG